MTETIKEPIATRRPRTRPAWRDDFQGVMDKFGSERGGPVRYDSKADTIEAWCSTGWAVMREGVPSGEAAYWYLIGRTDERAERSDD